MRQFGSVSTNVHDGALSKKPICAQKWIKHVSRRKMGPRRHTHTWFSIRMTKSKPVQGPAGSSPTHNLCCLIKL